MASKLTKVIARARPKPAAEEDRRPRVLVVDDDEHNLLAIGTVLEDIGEVVVARSGEEALRHLLKGAFAVILLDVYMPGMDGYETAQIIRERDQTKRIPIVFLSAVNKENEHLIRGYSMGAVDYVFKPVDPVVLRSKVAVFVDLFAKTLEIERKAKQEQALLDANLRANAERLRAEQELRRAEQRQAAIIQSLPIVLYLEPLNCEPRCPAYVSGDLMAITGFSHDDVLRNSKLWESRLHPDDRDRVLEALEARKTSGRFSVEYRWQCANGSYKHFHDQAVLLKDGRGRAIEFAGTLTDVTERRSLESQLIQAQKMDAIGKLTGGIAHDFNNLLAAVIGGLRLIERRASLNPDAQEVLGMTKRAAEQGTELVRRLLAFARRQQLQPTAIEIGSLAKAVTGLLGPTLGGRHELDWQTPKSVWNAFADPAQLELALMNLILNARDAMPDGGTILVTAENRPVTGKEEGLESGDYVVLAVTDTGCGIASEMIEKVLEPFVTTKDVGKGTGLGLSMVYGFARQSNGAFRLDSDLGRGTRAELWLPRSTATAEDRSASPEPATLRTGRPLRVLLVDDHEEVRATTLGMLEDLGHSVAAAANGNDALKMLDGQPGNWDLLITDYAMPHKSGTQLVEAARQHCPGLPALIITGYADSEAIGDRPNDVAILPKPFSMEQLAHMISVVRPGDPSIADMSVSVG
ncbi:MAG TPA: response regulator [Sphingomicrobium sp.]|nr:response regulator [Sphingomicrobium sp.]